MVYNHGFPGLSGNPIEDALRRAQAALAQDLPDEAERIAAGVLKASPRHAGALEMLGGALLMQGRHAEAIEPLEQAGRSRHDPKLDTKVAIALRMTGRGKEALVRLKRAVKCKPPYPPAFQELGLLLFTLGQYDQAAETLQRGLDVAPMMAELSVQLGHVHSARGDRAAAKVAFSRALSIDVMYGDALLSLAQLHFKDGEFEPAAALSRRCVMGQPDNTVAWLNLGHCLLALGQPDAGYDCFRAAARGGGKSYGAAVTSLAKSGRGRLFLRPSDAARFLRGKSG